MQSKANNIQKTADLFLGSMGNGVTAGKRFCELMNDLVTTKDTRVVARTIARLKFEKGDNQGFAACKAIIELIYPGTEVTVDRTKKDASFHISKKKGVTYSATAHEALNQGIKEKLSLRATLVSRVRGKPASQTKEQKAKTWCQEHTGKEINKRLEDLQEQIKLLQRFGGAKAKKALEAS